uniref:Polysaccharide deacetylase n=2 Tax=Tetraselmis sp. GSL018 TaxID=582737 RepID=A0A061R250_9CHLO
MLFVVFVPALFTLALYVMSLPRWLVRAVSRLAPDVVFDVPTTEKLIALTIDDAPSPINTREILRVLKKHNCKATFFIIGSQAERCPGVLREMYDEGHELANHTMFDTPSFRLSLQELEQQVDGCSELIEQLTRQEADGPEEQHRLKWFRPGHGWFTPGMLRLCQLKGYRVALGSVFGNDPWVKSPALLKWYYLKRAYPGAIMILHDGMDPSRAQTVEVLDSVLPRLKARGYTVTTVSELFRYARKDHFSQWGDVTR